MIIQWSDAFRTDYYWNVLIYLFRILCVQYIPLNKWLTIISINKYIIIGKYPEIPKIQLKNNTNNTLML